MNYRLVLGALLAVGLLSWIARPDAREHPPGVLAPIPPRQTALSSTVVPVERDGFVLTPVANFQLDARVLGRRDYDSGTEAEVSPLDLALGWGRMSDSGVLAEIDISQGNRFYYYRYSPYAAISGDEIMTSSANMHMVPANEAVLRQLQSVGEGDVVSLGGYLVDVNRPRDGFVWRTSTRRDDTDAGACEIVLVEWVQVR